MYIKLFAYLLQARFHSMHVAECSAFEVDLSYEPYTSTCLKDHPKPTDIDDPELNLSEWAEMNPEGISFRLNPQGYRYNNVFDYIVILVSS